MTTQREGASRGAGFSLVEVVIATGIFAVGVVVMLALLPALARQSAEASDLLTAQGLPDAIRVELQRRARADGWAALAAATPIDSETRPAGYGFAIARDGLAVMTGAEPVVSDRPAPYFWVELWRFGQPPLAFEADGSVLPIVVRVSWPYRIPGTEAPVSVERRSSFTFAMAIER